jgi:hypothetical protein
MSTVQQVEAAACNAHLPDLLHSLAPPARAGVWMRLATRGKCR